MYEVCFGRYDVSRDYGLTRIYYIYENDEFVGICYLDGAAYICGHYNKPQWVFKIRGETARFPADQEDLPEPYQTIRALARQVIC
ncbi:hypothetical protein [Thermogutta sp.]|uniref:hypothetical protein n=1 Tax=Thermogutta sp. TaxID=1962930 RepID=UPI0032208489